MNSSTNYLFLILSKLKGLENAEALKELAMRILFPRLRLNSIFDGSFDAVEKPLAHKLL